MPFGERLRQLRDAAGLTQEGLARRIDMSTATVYKLERREIDPAWSTVVRLAKALGVSVAAFADEKNEAETMPAPTKQKKERK
jgi:transcriptional regulator with XRE-family HTH domain